MSLETESYTDNNQQSALNFSPGGLQLQSKNKKIQEYIDKYPLRAAVLSIPILVLVIGAALVVTAVVLAGSAIFVIIAVPIVFVVAPIAKLLGADISINKNGIQYWGDKEQPKEEIVIHEDKFNSFNYRVRKFETQQKSTMPIEIQEPKENGAQPGLSISAQGMRMRSTNKTIQKFIDKYPLRAAVLAIPVIGLALIAAAIFVVVVLISVGLFVIVVVPVSVVGLGFAKLLGVNVAFSMKRLFAGKNNIVFAEEIIINEDSDFDLESIGELEDDE
ncbi:hypothetical protein HDV01_007065 [Terramyces sp. JEL0728]|nr:hypothetical protein HDV01_007065 [Terramyces sp. JEL0728]